MNFTCTWNNCSSPATWISVDRVPNSWGKHNTNLTCGYCKGLPAVAATAGLWVPLSAAAT